MRSQRPRKPSCFALKARGEGATGSAQRTLVSAEVLHGSQAIRKTMAMLHFGRKSSPSFLCIVFDNALGAGAWLVARRHLSMAEDLADFRLTSGCFCTFNMFRYLWLVFPCNTRRLQGRPTLCGRFEGCPLGLDLAQHQTCRLRSEVIRMPRTERA